MPTLVACLSTGKGTWGHINKIIQDSNFDKIILITNDYGKENFKADEKTELISLPLQQGIKELRDAIISALKPKLKDSEIAVNIISGSGKEHTALISALLKLGLSIKLIALTKDGIEEI